MTNGWQKYCSKYIESLHIHFKGISPRFLWLHTISQKKNPKTAKSSISHKTKYVITVGVFTLQQHWQEPKNLKQVSTIGIRTRFCSWAIDPGTFLSLLSLPAMKCGNLGRKSSSGIVELGINIRFDNSYYIISYRPVQNGLFLWKLRNFYCIFNYYWVDKYTAVRAYSH